MTAKELRGMGQFQLQRCRSACRKDIFGIQNTKRLIPRLCEARLLEMSALQQSALGCACPVPASWRGEPLVL